QQGPGDLQAVTVRNPHRSRRSRDSDRTRDPRSIMADPSVMRGRESERTGDVSGFFFSRGVRVSRLVTLSGFNPRRADTGSGTLWY
ncbi:hypothetical protein INR49_006914, partial [Caranx melampygus]